MTNKNKNKLNDEIIEELAMAVTHSEQGEYSKNENFVRRQITEDRRKTIDECLTIINNHINYFKRYCKKNGHHPYGACEHIYCCGELEEIIEELSQLKNKTNEQLSQSRTASEVR